MTDETETPAAAKRKENLKSLRGAIAALSTIADHVTALEVGLDRCVAIGGELRKMIGDDALIQAYYGPGRPGEPVSAQTLLAEMHKARARAAANATWGTDQ